MQVALTLYAHQLGATTKMIQEAFEKGEKEGWIGKAVIILIAYV